MSLAPEGEKHRGRQKELECDETRCSGGDEKDESDGAGAPLMLNGDGQTGGVGEKLDGGEATGVSRFANQGQLVPNVVMDAGMAREGEVANGGCKEQKD